VSRGPEIISLAAKRGIHLSLAGDRIRWRADNGMDTTVARAIREFRADVGRHVAVTAVMLIVSFGVALVVGSMSAMVSLGHHPGGLMMIPMQFSSSILNSIFSAAVGAWFLACFAALAVEPA